MVAAKNSKKCRTVFSSALVKSTGSRTPSPEGADQEASGAESADEEEATEGEKSAGSADKPRLFTRPSLAETVKDNVLYTTRLLSDESCVPGDFRNWLVNLLENGMAHVLPMCLETHLFKRCARNAQFWNAPKV
jgi:hypothetical protein